MSSQISVGVTEVGYVHKFIRGRDNALIIKLRNLPLNHPLRKYLIAPNFSSIFIHLLKSKTKRFEGVIGDTICVSDPTPLFQFQILRINPRSIIIKPLSISWSGARWEETLNLVSGEHQWEEV